MQETSFSRKSYVIGDHAFYRKFALIIIPIVLQNTLTNVVSLLDNVMVGQVGTLPMSGVAIVNSLLFVFYLCIFGGIAGAGIFGAQFYGKGDDEGLRGIFRIKLLIALGLCLFAAVLLWFWGDTLIGLYIASDTTPAVRAETLQHALGYLRTMMLGFLPFVLTQAYASTLRDTGETRVPMVASITAMLVNFVFNLILIFGLLGFPALGVIGAAIATVISRFVELFIVAAYTHRKAERFHFIQGAYSHFSIDANLARQVMVKALPLLLNEFIWSMGETILLQQYSTRGITAVAAMNINNTAAQVFNEFFLSMGVGAGILVGQELGAGRIEHAVRTAWRIVFASLGVCMIVGSLLALCSGLIPSIYNTEPEIRQLASRLLIVSACIMPARGFVNAIYFSIRAGGQVLLTLLFDSCYTIAIVIPTAFLLAGYTDLPIVPLYALCAGLEMVKCFLGVAILRRRKWARQIVG